MTSKTETAKQLVAIATDETRPLVERISSLEQADALRKELKAGWAKVGWTYEHVTPAGYLEDLNLWLVEERAKLKGRSGVPADVWPGHEDLEMAPNDPPKRMTPDELLRSKGAVTAKDFFKEVPSHEDFEMTADELADQALRPKAEPTLDDYVPTFEESHPGMTPQEEHQSDFVPPTIISEPPADNLEPEATEAPQPLTAAERGAIGVLSRDLLQTDAPYEEIALAVRARFPHARTTARSLASVAADMRRDGIPCPPRRKGGK